MAVASQVWGGDDWWFFTNCWRRYLVPINQAQQQPIALTTSTSPSVQLFKVGGQHLKSRGGTLLTAEKVESVHRWQLLKWRQRSIYYFESGALHLCTASKVEAASYIFTAWKVKGALHLCVVSKVEAAFYIFTALKMKGSLHRYTASKVDTLFYIFTALKVKRSLHRYTASKVDTQFLSCILGRGFVMHPN
jgi:hypothetical protein